MGERFGESVWDGWAQEQSEKRIAEMTAKKVLEAQRKTTPTHLPRHYTPPTVKDVLLKKWAQDTEEMAKKLIKYDNEDGGYFYDSIDTKSGRSYSEFYEVALKGEIAYLNSAAEVGK